MSLLDTNPSVCEKSPILRSDKVLSKLDIMCKIRGSRLQLAHTLSLYCSRSHHMSLFGTQDTAKSHMREEKKKSCQSWHKENLHYYKYCQSSDHIDRKEASPFSSIQSMWHDAFHSQCYEQRQRRQSSQQWHGVSHGYEEGLMKARAFFSTFNLQETSSNL